MQAAAFLTENINPTDDEIDVAMRGNLCRCMTYIRVRKAVKLAAEIKSGGQVMIEKKAFPPVFFSGLSVLLAEPYRVKLLPNK